MNQLEFYKYSTWALLFLNLAMVAFFYLSGPPRPEGREPGKDARNGAIVMLDLDEQQRNGFENLADQHMKLMDDLNLEQKNLIQSYFSRLIDGDSSVDAEDLLSKMPLVERKKIEGTYQHFMEIKALLKPSQNENFEAFVEHAVNRILLSSKSKKPPKRGAKSPRKKD